MFSCVVCNTDNSTMIMTIMTLFNMSTDMCIDLPCSVLVANGTMVVTTIAIFCTPLQQFPIASSCKIRLICNDKSVACLTY